MNNRLPEDPVEAWFSRVFRHRADLRAEIAADLRRCPVLLLDAPRKSLFGNITEIALGLALCDQPPYRRLLTCLDEGRAVRLLKLAGYRSADDAAAGFGDWQRADPLPHPARIFAAASRLAHVDGLLNDLGKWRPDVEDVAHVFLRRHPGLLNNRPNETFQARRAFRILWSSYTNGFHQALQSYGPATAQLPLLHGQRWADFLLGTTVLELKSGRLDEPRYLDALIRQFMTYALLAHHDGQLVTHVAVYAARYQRLFRYPFPELTRQLADSSIDLAETASELASVVLRTRTGQAAA